jgi:hypothetical protein
MKIKSIGYLSFLLSFENLDVVTDPQSLKSVGLKFPKTKADVAIYTDSGDTVPESKMEPSKKEEVLHINTPGEYELGGLMVRRDIGSSVYILDEDLLRIVYVGNISKDVKVESFKNLGDVEVLIIPVGDGKNFPEFGVIEKIVNEVEPLILIPSAFKTEEMADGSDLKTIDEFVKQAGYTNVTREKFVNVVGAPEKEVRTMDVIILE